MTADFRPDDKLLRLALRLNATFSATCALVCLLGAAPLAHRIGVSEPAVLVSLGANLAVFAAFLVWLSTRARIAPALVWTVIAADLLWVVGTVPLVAGDFLSPFGDGVAAFVAFAVAAWAALQTLGLRRSQAGASQPA